MDQQAIGETAGGENGAPSRQKRRRLTSTQRRARSLTRVSQAVEGAFDVKTTELQAATRGRCDVAFARQTAMYLARVALGLTLSQAGALFGRDRTTAAHACRLIEDLRDDPRFDTLLSAMEEYVLRADMADRRAPR